MAQTSTKPTDLNRAFEDARTQASGVAGAVSGAAQDVYGQARESAADVVDTAGTAARKTMSSFEKASAARSKRNLTRLRQLRSA